MSVCCSVDVICIEIRTTLRSVNQLQSHLKLILNVRCERWYDDHKQPKAEREKEKECIRRDGKNVADETIA